MVQAVAVRVKDISSELMYFSLFVCFIMLNLLRWHGQAVFPDVLEYQYIFERIPPFIFEGKNGNGLDDSFPNIEIGYRYFIAIFKLFSSSFSDFLFFISLTQISAFYYFCRRFKLSTVGAFPIYIALTYLTFHIGMLRQALAFCIFLIALIHIKNKLIYLVLICLGISFHTSMIFCLTLIWVDKFISRRKLFLLFLVALVLYIGKIDVVSYIISWSGYEEEFNAGRGGYYLTGIDRQNNYLGIGFWDRTILFVFMLLIYRELLFHKKINKYNNVIFNLGISVILMQIIFFSSPTITSRLRYYAIIFPVIFISEYIYVHVKSNMTWVYQVFFSVYLFMHLYIQAGYLV